MKYALPFAIFLAAFAAPLDSHAQLAASKSLAKPAKATPGPQARDAEQAKLQAEQDRQRKAQETANKLAKKSAETQSSVTGNLK